MKNGFVKLFADSIIRHRLLVITGSIVLIVILGAKLGDLQFDNSQDAWSRVNDPVISNWHKFRDRFGGNPQDFVIGVRVRSGESNLLDRDTLETIKKLTDFLESHKYAVKTSSILNYFGFTEVNGKVVSRPLIPDTKRLLSDKKEYERVLRILKEDEGSHGILYSKDLKHASIIVSPIFENGVVVKHKKLADDLYAFIEKENFRGRGFKIMMAGNLLSNDRIMRLIQKDVEVIYPIMLLVLVLALIAVFRSFSGVFSPFGILIFSCIATLGLAGWLGWKANTFNSALLFYLMPIGMINTICMLMRFNKFRSQGFSAGESAGKAIQSMLLPGFIASLAAAGIFFSLAGAETPPPGQFGILAAFGAMLTFLFSTITLPAILSFLKKKEVKKTGNHRFPETYLNTIKSFSVSNGKIIVGLTAALILISLFFIPRIRITSNTMNYFTDASNIKQSFKYFDRVYNGWNNFEYMIDSGKQNGALQPEFLGQVERFQEYLNSRKPTGKSYSLITLLRRINTAIPGEEKGSLMSQASLKQTLAVYREIGPTANFSDYISSDGRYLRVKFYIRTMANDELILFINSLNSELKEKFPGLSFVLTGDSRVKANLTILLQEALANSFVIALIVIVFLLLVFMRNIRQIGLILGLVSFPLIIMGGIIGALEILVDFSVITFCEVSLGAVVCNAILVVSKYAECRAERNSCEQSLYYALTEAGAGITVSSIILIFGFGVLLFSSFLSNFFLGFSVVMFLVLSLSAVFFVFPAFISLLERSDSKNVSNNDALDKAV